MSGGGGGGGGGVLEIELRDRGDEERAYREGDEGVWGGGGMSVCV